MLISPEYVALNAKLHKDNPAYGTRSYRWLEFVTDRIRSEGHKTVLEYGAGKGTLSYMLANCSNMPLITMVNYDPAIPAFAERPEPAEFVLCLDVLEHIEPDCLDEVLADLRNLTLKEALMVISLRPSSKTLPDGRNAHLLIKPPDWWTVRIANYFDTIAFSLVGHELRALLEPTKTTRSNDA